MLFEKRNALRRERLLSEINLYSKRDRKLVISQDVIEDSAARSHTSLTLNIFTDREMV